MSTRRHALHAAAVTALVGGVLLAPAAVASAGAPGPDPKPRAAEGHEVTVTLGHGAKAEVRNRDGSYVATLSVGDQQIATLSARHPTVTESGVRYELYPSNGHIGVTRLDGGNGAAAVTPRGGVAAGAAADRDAGNPVILAAGGGMAAAGAAGLGYAMLRRGRTDT
ncbi:hypothetical protein JQK87_35785 [Streptomyces sp. G44]|uniref:hypothetical protein n=1 Tax=Streptomyces sp. G44 TaxID=2807632 RepID=UPI001961AB31|nr:hypothetical protein [Streptomyces sp. G44]MBM7173652.1 hypothetical protein [Streptomyces sp. G44]